MRHIARWRWVLPFAQLCVILVCLKWIEDQRITRYSSNRQKTVPSGNGAAVGWDPVSCWDCDSVGPLPIFVFLGILGLFYWIGIQFDRKVADAREVTGQDRILPLVLGCAFYIGACVYTLPAAIFALTFVGVTAVLFSAAVQAGRRIARACGVSVRARSVLLTIAAVSSIGLVIYAGIAGHHCGAACLVMGSCLVIFGLFCARQALIVRRDPISGGSVSGWPDKSVSVPVVLIAVCVATECAIIRIAMHFFG